MFAVIFDCDFEGSTGCGLTMNGFAKASYRSTEILDPPDKSDFGGKYLKCPTLLFLCFFTKSRLWIFLCFLCRILYLHCQRFIGHRGDPSYKKYNRYKSLPVLGL